MFLKRKLKIYLIMLSILVLSAPINAMKQDEIKESIINTNEIKEQGFEEENSEDNIEIINNNNEDIKIKEDNNLEDKKYSANENINMFNNKSEIKNENFEEENSEDNIEINKIEKEIDKMKENLKNNVKYYIYQYINELKKHEENLLSLKKKTNNETTIDTINNMLDKINTLHSKLIISKIKKEINIIKKIDFNNKNIDNMIHYRLDLDQYEKNLLSLKEKTNKEKKINAINCMLDEINTQRNNLSISQFKKEIDEIKKEINSKICEIKNLSTWVFILYADKKGLLDLKQETNNEETINTIDSMLDEINNLIWPKVKKIINIINRNEKTKKSIRISKIK